MSEKREVRGADVSSPIAQIRLDGADMPLKFDLNAFRVAEDIYEIEYGRDLNFARIITQLSAGKLGAVMAVLYGALVSAAKDRGEKPMTWAEYAGKFRLESIPGVTEMLMEKVAEAMPEAGGKNPQ